MARTRKTDKSARSKSKSFAIFDDEEQPRRRRAKKSFRRTRRGGARSSASTRSCSASASRSCRGRILNRERINKTIEGIYFICASCKKVCHNLDEGLVEDPNNVNNLCTAVRDGEGAEAAAAARAARPPPRPSQLDATSVSRIVGQRAPRCTSVAAPRADASAAACSAWRLAGSSPSSSPPYTESPTTGCPSERQVRADLVRDASPDLDVDRRARVRAATTATTRVDRRPCAIAGTRRAHPAAGRPGSWASARVDRPAPAAGTPRDDRDVALRRPRARETPRAAPVHAAGRARARAARPTSRCRGDGRARAPSGSPTPRELGIARDEGAPRWSRARADRARARARRRACRARRGRRPRTRSRAARSGSGRDAARARGARRRRRSRRACPSSPGGRSRARRPRRSSVRARGGATPRRRARPHDGVERAPAHPSGPIRVDAPSRCDGVRTQVVEALDDDLDGRRVETMPKCPASRSATLKAPGRYAALGRRRRRRRAASRR